MTHYLQTFLRSLGIHEKRKARNILIRPGFQLRLPLYILLLSVVFVSLSLQLANMYLDQAYAARLGNSADLQYLPHALISQMTSLSTLSLLLLFVYAVLVVVISSIYTHRLLGPMVPISRHLKALNEGFYAHRLQLREHDALHELADQLNELAETLEQRKQE
jgi:hypothetical protein